MKTIKTVIVGITIILSSVSSGLQAQCLKTGDNVIDISYGGAGVTDYLLLNTVRSGVITAKIEHMFADKISVGLDVNYQKNYNSDMYNVYSYEPSAYYYNLNQDLFRYMATINYHYVTTDDFDTYLLFGTGYVIQNSKISTNDPNYIKTESGQMPFTLRVGLGGRYFIAPNFGLNLEFGIGGGSILQGGFCVKF